MTQGDLLPGQGVTILPHSHKQRHRWLDSLTQWLSEAGMNISRQGARETDLKGDQLIYDYLPYILRLNVLDDINGLSEPKLDSVLLHMRQQSISVYTS